MSLIRVMPRTGQVPSSTHRQRLKRSSNTELVSSAVVCDSRGPGPWYRISMTTGQEFIAQGKPSDLLAYD